MQNKKEVKRERGLALLQILILFLGIVAIGYALGSSIEEVSAQPERSDPGPVDSEGNYVRGVSSSDGGSDNKVLGESKNGENPKNLGPNIFGAGGWVSKGFEKLAEIIHADWSHPLSDGRYNHTHLLIRSLVHHQRGILAILWL